MSIFLDHVNNNISASTGNLTINGVAPQTINSLLTSISGLSTSTTGVLKITNGVASIMDTGGGGGGSVLATPIKTTNYTAEMYDLVRADTTETPITITFPSSPTDGTQVGILDVAKTFSSHPVTLVPGSGATIEGDAISLTLDVNGAYALFVYNAATTNWRLLTIPFTFSGNTSASGLKPTPIKISNYLAGFNELVRCNTSAGMFSVTLPTLPTDGTMVGIVDIYSTFGSNNLILYPAAGNTVEFDSGAVILDIDSTYITLMYIGANSNWKVLETPNIIASSGSSGSGGGTGLTASNIKTSNYTAAINELVRCDTTLGAFSVTFPGSPTDGATVAILDITNSFSTNPVTVLPNTGKTVESDNTAFILDVSGTYVSFVYNSLSANWKLLETPSGGSSSVITYGTGVTNWLTAPSSANLIAAITDETGSGSLVFNTSPTIAGLKETKIALAANDINLSLGNAFTKTIIAATTLTVSNVPVTDTLATFILELTNGGSAIVTWWSGIKWVGGTVPTLTTTGRDTIGFYTHDGGVSWTGLIAKDIK